MSRIAFLLIVFLLPASAQEVLFRQVADTKTDTYVEATALFSHPSLGGYHPVRVVIANRQKIPHSVFLDFNDTTSYNSGISASSDFAFAVEPGKTVTYDILVPLSAQNGMGDYQTLNTSLRGTMGKTQHSDSAVFDSGNPAVLLSDSLHGPNASALDSELSSRGTTSSYSRSGSTTFSSRFSAKQLPDDWRAFSGFDSVMMTEEDWSVTPPGPRNAIVSWVRLGGQLVIFSQSSPTLPSLGLPEDPSFGEVVVKPVAADLRLDASDTVDIAFSRTSGAKTRMSAITNDFDSRWPAQQVLGEKSFNYATFIVILIAFGIVVGPVNLFVFAKSGRRHRLFVTTPLISLATSLILVALIILQDGFGGDGHRVVLMEVRPDENQNAAFIHQEQFSRTGVMTSPAFTIEASAFIAPVPIAQSRWSRFTDDYDTRGTYDIQPADGKLFASGGWFQSRSEQGQLITAVVPTRGRIEATDRPDTLVSTFDFPIETLLYRDAEGKWHRADKVTKGKRVTLSQVDPTMVQPVLNDLANRFTERNRSFFRKIDDRKDHFVAFTEKAPGIGTHPGIDWTTATVITGPIAR